MAYLPYFSLTFARRIWASIGEKCNDEHEWSAKLSGYTVHNVRTCSTYKYIDQANNAKNDEEWIAGIDANKLYKNLSGTVSFQL